jgi:hypothetical protein
MLPTRENYDRVQRMTIAWDKAQEHLRYALASLEGEIVRGKSQDAYAAMTEISEVETLMDDRNLLAALDKLAEGQGGAGILGRVARDPHMGQAFWYHMAQAFRHIIRAIERSAE